MSYKLLAAKSAALAAKYPTVKTEEEKAGKEAPSIGSERKPAQQRVRSDAIWQNQFWRPPGLPFLASGSDWRLTARQSESSCRLCGVPAILRLSRSGRPTSIICFVWASKIGRA